VVLPLPVADSLAGVKHHVQWQPTAPFAITPMVVFVLKTGADATKAQAPV